MKEFTLTVPAQDFSNALKNALNFTGEAWNDLDGVLLELKDNILSVTSLDSYVMYSKDIEIDPNSNSSLPVTSHERKDTQSLILTQDQAKSIINATPKKVTGLADLKIVQPEDHVYHWNCTFSFYGNSVSFENTKSTFPDTNRLWQGFENLTSLENANLNISAKVIILMSKVFKKDDSLHIQVKPNRGIGEAYLISCKEKKEKILFVGLNPNCYSDDGEEVNS